MYIIHDDNSIEMVRGDSADFDIYLPLYEVVLDPTGSPKENGYYERVNNAYILSSDMAVNPNKTYYTLEGEYELQEGDVLLFTVKKSTKTDEVIFQKSGQHVEIFPEDTETLPYGKYIYDVELTYASGFRDTVIRPKELKLTDEATFHGR